MTEEIIYAYTFERRRDFYALSSYSAKCDSRYWMVRNNLLDGN